VPPTDEISSPLQLRTDPITSDGHRLPSSPEQAAHRKQEQGNQRGRGQHFEQGEQAAPGVARLVVALLAWGFAGLGIFDDSWPTQTHPHLYAVVKGLLFVISSLALRECWHVGLEGLSLQACKKEVSGSSQLPGRQSLSAQQGGRAATAGQQAC